VHHPEVGSTTDPLIGREEELAAVSGFLEALREAPRALVLEGEAGIGKTRVWREGVEVACARGCRVLVAQPAGGEVRLAFAALGDLLGDLPPAALAALPAPQRRALRIALLVEEAGDGALDQRLIGVALLEALRALASDGPVLIAIDDLQWLDGASAAALGFAARRLREERVGFLLTIRTGEDVGGLDQALPEPVRRIGIGPLSIGAVQSLLRQRIGAAFPRPTLRRLWQTCRGNPFYALELGRTLLEHGGRFPQGESVPIPLSLADLLRRRVGAVPQQTRDVLLAAAIAASPSVDTVRTATGADAWERLRPGFEAQLVKLDGSRLRFAHPLLAAAVAANADPGRRRELHARFADAVADPEERAWRLALAADGADAHAAAALEAAAARAGGRGAPDTAAQLLELAVRLTPAESTDDAVRRALAAARAHDLAGDAGRAEEILNALIVELPAGPRRAEALLALMHTDTTARNRALAEQALREAADDAKLRARILIEFAQWLEITEGPPAGLGCAREALALAEPSGDKPLLLQALSIVGHLETLAGGEDWLALLERARALEAQGFSVPRWVAPGHWIGVRLMWADELDRARELLEAEYRQAVALGDEASRAGLCFHLTQLETRAGNAARAHAYAAEGWELEEAGGREQSRAVSAYARALAEAHFGDAGRARALAADVLTVFEALGDHFFTMHTRSVLALLALGEGDYEAAHRALDGLRELRAAIGIGEPGIFPFDSDEIEALVGIGQLDAADALVATLKVRGRELDRPRLLATAERCRGLILASRGRPEEAVGALQRALHEHQRLPVPLERARTLLALGTVQRRARRKRAAREALEAALALFSQLGSNIWAERARGELARIGGRAPSGSTLTAGERRVAALVAHGRTNREVAAELFVTVNTVESTLRRVYSKLGVRSRAELASRFARR
jgi:DNA-binding NarL/FixJ family response regulator